MLKTLTRPKLQIFFFSLLVLISPAIWAGDYLFVSVPYLKATKQVIGEADIQAPIIFGSTSPFIVKYQTFRDNLVKIIDTTQQKRLQKKIKADMVDDVYDKNFADSLNSFKDAINFMARQSGKSLGELLPSYDRWTRLETSVVKTGLDQRLAAYQTRFGPDSEPINIIELFLGEKFLPGNEAGPSPWEPILRFSAVQFTNQGSGLTSSIEVGGNYYFIHGAPSALQMAGLSNHVGVAGLIQYAEDPGVFQFQGRPSFGVMFHLDRKEAGLTWNPVDEKIRFTVGYAFQFIPFVM